MFLNREEENGPIVKDPLTFHYQKQFFLKKGKTAHLDFTHKRLIMNMMKGETLLMIWIIG